MVGELGILAVEIGFLAGAVAMTQSVRFVVGRIERARTAAGIRKMLRALPEPPKSELEAGYRENVAMAVSAEERSAGFVERWRAKRAAAYVHELERRAKIDT
jgi:hypothetical protein